jgi:peptidoglycan/LPS O-acetylase OafA/YrhL
LTELDAADPPRAAGRRRTPRTEFRPDIEGLRAVAVIAVVLYHAGIPGTGGGYIGVDVFFVISGFLITGLLWREAAATNTVRLGRFYAARARRLLPAAATVGLVTAIAAAVVLPPLQARRVFMDGIASALYVGNYRFAGQGTDYLMSDLPPSPFQHYWSLGVEEQFYLVWPVLIIGTAWLVRRARKDAKDTGAAAPYAVVLGSVGAASLAAAVIWTRTQPTWAFFSLPTRAWELAAGGLVALSIRYWRRLPLWPAAVAGWGGLALILLTCTQLGPHTPYPGTSALLPVLGTALVIGAGSVTGGMGVGRVLGPPAMRAIGRVSYSWYLWHWPVLLLMPPLLGDPTGLPGRLAATIVSAGLAVLTLHLVENPGRFAGALRGSAKTSLALAGAASAAAACACVLLLTLIPVPVGRGVAAPQAKITNISGLPPTGANAQVSPQEEAVRQAFAQVRDAVAVSAGLRAVPSNLNPPVAQAPADKAAVFVNGCTRSWRDVGQSECATGDTASPTTVALVGDSHAAMWNPAFAQVAEQRHWRLETMAKVTCPLQDLPIVSPYLGRRYTECEQWRSQIMDRVQAEHPRLVVLSMSRRYAADFGFVAYDPAWIDTLTRTVAQLRRTGATVLVLGPAADPQSSVPTCLSAHLDDATACAPSRSVAVNGVGIGAEQAATTAGGGHYADLTDLFCAPDRCPVIVGNTLVFRDDNHVSTEYAQWLAPVIGALTDRALADN